MHTVAHTYLCPWLVIVFPRGFLRILCGGFFGVFLRFFFGLLLGFFASTRGFFTDSSCARHSGGREEARNAIVHNVSGSENGTNT